MEAGSELGARQMAGFKDFYQSVQLTRVIAGRDLLSSRPRPAITRVWSTYW